MLPIRIVFVHGAIAVSLEIEFSEFEMPTSARLVLLVLRRLRIADFRTLERETGLSKRSVLYAVKNLRDMKLIDIQICLNDARKRFYCIKIMENRSL